MPMESKRKIDEIDRIIIKSLLKNSRTSFLEIAKQCKLSTLTIKNRYRRLKKDGIIKGSTLILNQWAFEGNTAAIFLVTIPDQEIISFEKTIQNLIKEQTLLCQRVEFNERYNLVVSLSLEKIGDIAKIRETIKGQPCVTNVETNIVSSQRLFPENLDFTSLS